MSSSEPPMPMATPLAQVLPPITALPASTSSRRLPPPCWTPDETSALIHSYRDKWYSLRRSHLRSNHWEQVASDVHRLCPHAPSPKTYLQCRHKMEKLRKRYRDEIKRAVSIPHHRFSSSWPLFSLMDDLDKGPTSSNPPVVASVVTPAPDDDDDDDDDGGDDDLNDTEDDYDEPRRELFNHHRSAELGFQSKKNYAIPTASPKYGYRTPKYNGYDDRGSGFDEGLRYAANKTGRSVDVMNGLGKEKKGSGSGSKRRRGSQEVAMEMVEAVRMLGEGLVRTEKMKMEMMRESERMRMEMEMKRTQMILDAQHRMLQAFSSNHPSTKN